MDVNNTVHIDGDRSRTVLAKVLSGKSDFPVLFDCWATRLDVFHSSGHNCMYLHLSFYDIRLINFLQQRSFNKKLPPIIFYLVKSIYLLISAYQIRCGYPLRILGNFLMKKFNIVNQYLFDAYWTVPFLLELRTLMDWIWTDTSLCKWKFVSCVVLEV